MCCFGDLQTAKEVFSYLKKKGVKYIIGYKRFNIKIDKNGKTKVVTPIKNYHVKNYGWIKAKGVKNNYKYDWNKPRGIHVYFNSGKYRVPVKVMLDDIIAAENKYIFCTDKNKEFVATKVYIYKKDFNKLLFK
jgi:ribosomal protein L30E